MFGLVQPTGGPGRGIFPGGAEMKFQISGALPDKDCVQLNFENGTGDPGNNASGFALVKNSTTALAFANVFGVLDGASTNGSINNVILAGFIPKMKVPSGASKGDRLIPGAGGDLAVAETGGGALSGKVVAIMTEDESGGEADVWFNGIKGFGYFETAA
jgi:hypothetical protein